MPTTAPDTTAQLAKDIKARVKQCWVIEIWGDPVFPPGDQMYDVTDVTAAGGALVLHLVMNPDGVKRVLEVSEPRNAKVKDRQLEIGQAASVRWDGNEPRLGAGQKKPALVIK